MASTYDGEPIRVEMANVAEDDSLHLALKDGAGSVRWLILEGRDAQLVEKVLQTLNTDQTETRF